MFNPNAKLGIGGAPTRATTLPDDPKARKAYPVASGFLDYFPDAVAAVANLSHIGNEQHNPGQPLHWARGKSGDEADTMMRHFLQRGTTDTDGVRHSVKMAWRALALLQKEIEEEQKLSQVAPLPAAVGKDCKLTPNVFGQLPPGIPKADLLPNIGDTIFHPDGTEEVYTEEGWVNRGKSYPVSPLPPKEEECPF